MVTTVLFSSIKAILVTRVTRILYRFHLIDIPSPEISKTGSHSKNQSITESESSVHMSSVVWCDSHVCWCPVLFNHSFTCCYPGCHGNYWWIQGICTGFT